MSYKFTKGKYIKKQKKHKEKQVKSTRKVSYMLE